VLLAYRYRLADSAMGLIDTLEASVKVLPPVKTRGEGHGIANSDIKNLRD